MFQTSDSTAKLDAALAKAQGEIEAAEKSAKNDAFKKKDGKVSTYADINAVLAVIKPALAKHEISLTQWPVHREGSNRLHMITRLAHAGEWMMGELSLPVLKQDAQGFGAAITYARRYGSSAAVGVVTDEDDDGNGAGQSKETGNGKLGVYSPSNSTSGLPKEVTGSKGVPKYKNGKATAPTEYMFLESAMRAQRTAEDLREWAHDQINIDAMNKLPEEWLGNLQEEYDQRLAVLRGATQ